MIAKGLRQQVGGSHYLKYRVQPLQVAEDLDLTPVLFCAFKYLVRYKDKNGLQDLAKAKHCVDLFAEFGKEKTLNFDDPVLADFFEQFSDEHGKMLYGCLRLQMDRHFAPQLHVLIDQAMEVMRNGKV